MARNVTNPAQTWDGHARRKARDLCFATKGRVCYLCGHDGANDVDHIISRNEGGSMFDPANHAPSHGVSGCPTCGRKCNRDKSDKPLAMVQRLRTSRDWYSRKNN